MPVDKVIVRAPATSANMGPGFDSLGFAMELRDELTFERTADRESQAITVDPDGNQVSLGVPTGSDNLAIRAFATAFREAGQEAPAVRVRIINRIPVARGLGSSAAAIVAGLMAADVFMGVQPDMQRLLNTAARIEGHPDNTAACILGGITSSSFVGARVLWARVPICRSLRAVVAVPDFLVSTRAARNVLPGNVPYSDAVFNVGRVALLVASLASGNYANLRYAFDDRLHQPYRSGLVPGMVNAMKAACDAGALGSYMSGAGPSILALIADDGPGELVAAAMKEAFALARVTAATMVLPTAESGALFEVA
jgi:homoserine kinase